MPHDDNITEREQQTRLLRTLRHMYRCLLFEVQTNPNRTADEINTAVGFNTGSLLTALDIKAEQFASDLEAMAHYQRMTRWLEYRAEGQASRMKSIARLEDKLANGWDLSPLKLARIRVRLHAERDCVIEYARLGRRRREFCARFPHLFGILVDDGSPISDMFERDI